MSNSKGFTLVELAIVLVIIGVILGGVVKGTELVQSARAKRVYKDVQNVQTAFMTSVDINGVIPGLVTTGDDAGTITNANFWQSIRNDNLFTGSGNASPNNSFGGAITIVTNAMTTTAGNHYVCSAGLPQAVIDYIDTQYDDGVGNTGDILASTATTTAGIANFAATTVLCARLQ
ncbi:type II secretion system protein [Seleniivibrio woodruffii]|uniref:type II secretion system protein n=1 Tax=Seleniivibrio woodruffii TaxID=1078050 RepID=UPI00240A62EE|nr:prepilin-type N-terminal cleavage/methylation domain-containing protein [Seleniivibrio woodruffii]